MNLADRVKKMNDTELVDCLTEKAGSPARSVIAELIGKEINIVRNEILRRMREGKVEKSPTKRLPSLINSEE